MIFRKEGSGNTAAGANNEKSDKAQMAFKLYDKVNITLYLSMPLKF